ncbi:MAG: hypothetical protein GPJ52_03895 [Candidatus Heimdallarchaeota archaeon]|nr:hypothetical protein [Candidatus Heimdallarchaeota archaeon]
MEISHFDNTCKELYKQRHSAEERKEFMVGNYFNQSFSKTNYQNANYSLEFNSTAIINFTLNNLTKIPLNNKFVNLSLSLQVPVYDAYRRAYWNYNCDVHFTIEIISDEITITGPSETSFNSFNPINLLYGLIPIGFISIGIPIWILKKKR